jgi:hypothetical protein
MAGERNEIPMSTTDSIPSASQRAVKASDMAWASSQISVLDARNQLAAWADRHGYDAVVGVRLIAKPGVRVIDWVIYGTAISWDG